MQNNTDMIQVTETEAVMILQAMVKDDSCGDNNQVAWLI
jgi:hypothetical protein